MDCEKFEAAIIDELYGELDELTSAAAKRHLAGCARCSARIGGLRATRRVAVVPLVEPPGDLEERILRAADRAWMTAPPRPRLAQLISLAGSWAMRPQTAMAAVFLVMIGTSLLLLRGKSGRAPASAEVTVTEQGTPAPAACVTTVAAPVEVDRAKTPAYPGAAPEAKQALAQSSSNKEALLPGAGPFAAPPPAMRASPEYAGAGQALDERPPDDERFDAALRSYRAGRFNEAVHAFDALSPSDPNAPDLWAARATRDGKGCRAAVTRFDKTAQHYRQAPPGWDALLEGALCYRALGDFGTARARLTGLLGIDSHKDRARAELERIDQLQQAQASSEPPVAAKPAKMRAATAPAIQAAPPQAVPAPPAAAAGEAPDSNR